MPWGGSGGSFGGGNKRRVYTDEELYVDALETVEKQLSKLNFLVDIDLLNKSLQNLKTHKNASFSSKYAEREIAVLKEANMIRLHFNEEKEKLKLYNQEVDEKGKSSVVPSHQSIMLPMDVLQNILSHLPFFVQMRSRCVSRFFRESMDNMFSQPMILLCFNFVLDTQKYPKVLRNGETIKLVGNAFNQSSITFTKNYDTKKFSAEILKAGKPNTVLNLCLEYNRGYLSGDKLKKSLLNMLNKDKSDQDVFCALILLELNNNKDEHKVEMKSYLFQLFFYFDYKQKDQLEESLRGFLERFAFYGGIKQHRVEELTQEIVKFAVEKELVPGNEDKNATLSM